MDLRDTTRLEVLVGGHDPDKIFQEGADRTRSAREAQEARAKQERTLQEQEAARQKEAAASSAKGTTGRDPFSGGSISPTPLTIEEHGTYFEIKGDPFCSHLYNPPYETHLAKDPIDDGKPHPHAFWVDHTNFRIQNGAFWNNTFYAASGSYYLHLIEALRDEEARLLASHSPIVVPGRNEKAVAMIGRMRSLIKTYLERSVIHTLTQANFAGQSDMGMVIDDDSIKHAAGTPYERESLSSSELHGKTGAFSDIDDGEFMSATLFEMSRPRLLRAVRWLQGNDAAEPRLDRYTCRPSPKHFSVPLELEIFKRTSYSLNARIMGSADGTILPIRIIDGDGKEVVR